MHRAGEVAEHCITPGFCESHLFLLPRGHTYCIRPVLSVLAAVAQELSKIAMPIVLNEPLSFLQRISEYMEHTYLIHKACTMPDPLERMQVRALFPHTHLHTHSHTLWLGIVGFGTLSFASIKKPEESSGDMVQWLEYV